MDWTDEGPLPQHALRRWSQRSAWRATWRGSVADHGQLAQLRQLRPPPPVRPWWQVAALLVASLLLHGGVVWMLAADDAPWQPVRSPHPARDVLHVTLIDAPATSPQVLPALQVRPPPHRPAASPDIPPPARQPDARTAPPPESSPESSPEPPRTSTAARLFDRDGQVIVPGSGPQATDSFRVGRLDSDAVPRPQHNPVPYTPTRFAKAWVPEDESLLQEAVRKTTVAGRVLHLPGVDIACFISPLALALGCQPVAPKQMSAPLQVHNTRINLPSATPLVAPSAARSSPSPAAAASVTEPSAEPAERADAASADEGAVGKNGPPP